MNYGTCKLSINTVKTYVNQLYLAAIKFGGFATFRVIIEVFPYIILFNFKFNSAPNLVDLQYGPTLQFIVHFCAMVFGKFLPHVISPLNLTSKLLVYKQFNDLIRQIH